MKNLFVLCVVAILASFCSGCSETVSKSEYDALKAKLSATTPAPNEAAAASAHILGAIPAGESASVKAETIVGEAAVMHEVGLISGNVTLTGTDGRTVRLNRTTTASTPQAQKLDINVKVADGSLFVRDGNLKVGNGNLSVGSGTLGVGNGNLRVGSGTLNVNAVASGSVSIDGHEFVVYKDQCGGVYYRGTDGNLYPIH